MVTTKMPDTVQKDENHNVIMPMSIFIFFSYELFACHLYRGQLVAGLLFLVFSFFFSIGIRQTMGSICANHHLNVKPTEYYDYFVTFVKGE